MDREASRPARAGDLGLLLAIGLLGLVVRLAYAVEFAGHPVGRMTWVDEGAYWSRAREIGAGRWLPDGPFYQDPLFPYVLSALSGLVGPDVPRLRIALACLGALTPPAIFWAGRRGLGRAEAIVAGLAGAVYAPLIFTDALLEKEGLGALAAAVALGLVARTASAGPRPGPAAAAGFAWGVVALLRSNALVVAPIGAAWAACLTECDGGRDGRPCGRLRRALAASGFLAGFGLALAPAAVVNAAVGRPPELLLTTWQLGANFYIGNGPGATGTYRAPDFVEANPAREAGDFAAEARRRSGRALTPGQVSRFWLAEGLRRWREAPAASAALLAHKAALLAHDFEIPDNQDPQFVRLVAAPALGLGVLSFGWIAPWSALGLGRTPRTPFWWFLVASTAAGLASTAAFFVVGRYRIPWTPGLLLLGAAGAVDLARRVRARQWRALAWRVGLLFLPAAALAWRPMVDPAPDRWAHMLISLALAEAAAGRPEPAIDALDDARAMGPGPAERVEQLLSGGPLRDALGRLAAAGPGSDQSRVPRAASELRRARWLRQFPESRPESRHLLDRSLGADPEDSRAIRERGAWWLGLPGDPVARRLAIDDLTRAADGPAGDPSAAILLALLVKDRSLLPLAGRVSPGPPSARLRLARAALSPRFAPPDPGTLR